MLSRGYIGPPVVSDYEMADTFYDRLESFITEAQSELEENQQLEISYASPAGEIITVTDIGYHNPYLIRLYGKDKRNQECTVLVHMNSVQLIVRTANLRDAEQHRRIGFLSDST